MQKIKNNLRWLLPLALVLLSAGYLINLFLTNTNTYYINSTYFNFNFAMALILLVLGIAGVFTRSRIRVDWKILPLIIFLAIALLVPAQPLSSATASSRNLNVSKVDLNETQSSPLLQKDPRSLRVADWVKLKTYDANPARFKGQPVAVVGFVFRSDESQGIFSEDNFLVGRFVVTCCAVDAAPVGLEVATKTASGKNWLDSFKVDDWIKVEGQWVVVSRDGQEFLIVEANNITSVERPTNPYE